MDETKNKKILLPSGLVVSFAVLAGLWVFSAGQSAKLPEEIKISADEGIVLPVVWGDLGAKLVGAGVIDADKFISLYSEREYFGDEEQKLLLGKNEDKLKITKENAGYLLNLFWALGLGNKNPILDTGEMVDSAYGGAQNFASTGGWTIAKGNAMDHYSRHKVFDLTQEQQVLVDKLSRGIYRPCCNNSTHFPDCNHGMAMLGFLELMASQGVSEEEMWKAALVLNSYWFPENYSTIARYLAQKGIAWENTDPKEILGPEYSSASGYQKILSQVAVPQKNSGGSCGV